MLHVPVTKGFQSNKKIFPKALAEEFNMGFCGVCVILLAPKFEVYYTRLGRQRFT